MVLKYPINIGNNPADLLSPQHDSFVSSLSEDLLISLQKRGLRRFSYYDPRIDKKFIIKIEDYFLQPTFDNSEYMVLRSSQLPDHFQSYNLFLNIKICSSDTIHLHKWVCVGHIPKMQERGGFIRNGVKRVLLHQLVRSPGLYRNVTISAASNDVYNPFLKHRKAIAKVIPEYGTWLRIEALFGGQRGRSMRKKDQEPFYTRDRILCTTDSLLRVPFVSLLSGLGISPTSLSAVCSIGSNNNPHNLQIWNEEIREAQIGSFPRPWSRQQVLSSLWLKIKPYKRRRVPRTPEAVSTLLMESFYNPTTYSLGSVGRKQLYSQLGTGKLNRKTSNSMEISDLCVIANQLITMRWDKELSPKNSLSTPLLTNPESLDNRMVRTSGELLINCIVSELSNLDRVDRRFRTKQEGNLARIQSFNQNFVDTNWEFITSSHYSSIIKSKNRLQIGHEDHIGSNNLELKDGNVNRSSCENHIKETVLQRFVFLCQDAITRSTKTFLTAIQISQLEDTLNPLSDLTLKRRISVLGPGGITRSQASITMRNIHPTTYGRLCPIETPEGQNAGLVRSLAMHAFIPLTTGQIEVPFIDLDILNNQSFIKYTDSFTDKAFSFGLPDVMSAEKNLRKSASILIKQGLFFNKAAIWDCSFFGISPVQLLSVGTTLTPFLEHDDATRVLMGSNMQRQSLSLASCERPIVGTGSEILIGVDSRHLKRSSKTGIICGLSSQSIHILKVSYRNYLKSFKYAPNLFSFFNSYNIHKDKNRSFNFFPFTRHENIITKIPLSGPKRSSKSTVSRSNITKDIGDWVGKGSLISQETGLENGQLALGCNLRVVYMPWDGFNFEDAIVFNQTTAFSEKLKSFHLKRFDVIIPSNQIITSDFSDVPGILSSTHKHLDSNGFVIPGSCVRQGDALVGVIGRNTSSKSWKVRLMKKLAKVDPDFPIANYELVERSFFVPLGLSGRIVAVQKRQILDGLHVRIYLLITRFLQVGDKLSGRHGNKGVVSTLVPSCDMPYKPSGEQADIILNPLGVPSRMNLGQIFESLLGLAGQQLQQRYKILAFDEIFAFEASKRLCYTKLYEAQTLIKDNSIFDFAYPGKTWMIDGRNGKSFEQPVVFGVSYILKLCHQVDEKLHGRSTGEYSLITQQPVQGRARGGGQRVGEMEVWAFQGFGTSYMLQELLSIKSDDVKGRKEAAKILLRGRILYTKEFKSYRKPQTLQVVSYEMRALCMDFKLSSG